ncbi:DUF2267 domain-containing protein [Phytohabitans aurantiacus]|uniref:DUF2267 domain-containing protein n=1 Tax=Phytohabitans aurantiacus TaxID=3016789 RepID=UPI00389A5898
MPELLRGVYYDGWQPHRVPVKYGLEGYVARFAREARIPADEVLPAAAIVTKVHAERLSPGQLARGRRRRTWAHERCARALMIARTVRGQRP